MLRRDPTAEAGQQACIDEHAARLVVRLDSCPSAELRSEADSWIEANPKHAVAFAIADSRWRLSARVRLRGAPQSADAEDAECPTPRRRDRTQRPDKDAAAWPGRLLSRRQAAGAAAVLCGLGWSGWYLTDRADRRVTGFGERSVAALADGSTISLNSETSAIIELDPRRRQVWLEKGEAFFEIARDVTRPFLIETSGARIAVLGTKFNVRTRGEVTEVAVTEGLVVVKPGSGESVDLPADAVAVIGPHGVTVSRNIARTVERKVAWSKGFIQFDSERLDTVIAEFNQYRRTPIQAANSRTAQIKITGRFGLNESEDFLVALESSFNLKTVRLPDKVLVSQ